MNAERIPAAEALRSDEDLKMECNILTHGLAENMVYFQLYVSVVTPFFLSLFLLLLAYTSILANFPFVTEHYEIYAVVLLLLEVR